MGAHTCNPNTWETEVRGSKIQGQPQLPKEFQGSQGHARPCLKQQQQQNQEDNTRLSR